MSQTLKERLSSVLAEAGFDRFGVANLERPMTFSFYEEWLKKGHQAGMEYLVTHSPLKEQPDKLLPQARSSIVVAVDYCPHPSPADSEVQGRLERLSVARYARGQDYHFWLLDRLSLVAKKLQEQFPNETFLCMTDSKPVLERDLAYRAGLGWVGKNACLIDEKRGSFFLIGEIYTTMTVEASVDLAADRCGTCTRCIDACPTQALVAPKDLDARKCISYWTIEAKAVEVDTTHLKNGARDLGTHYFGCDICQTVCPWNRKIIGVGDKPDATTMQEDLRWILTASTRQIEGSFKNTSLNRLRAYQHRRNALTVVLNNQMTDLIDEVHALTSDERIGPWASQVHQSLLQSLEK